MWPMLRDSFMPDSGEPEDHAHRMSFLHEISSVAISSLDARKIAERIASIVHTRSGALFTSVRLANRERSRLHIVASHGLPSEYLDHTPVIDADADHLVPHVFATGTPVWGAHARKDSLGKALTDNLRTWEIDTATLLVLPLKGASSTVGVITLGWHEERDFDHDEIDFYASVANILAVGVENAYLLEDEREAAAAAKRLSAASNQLAAEFSGIFESLTDAVVVLNAAGVVMRTNEPARRMFGFDPLGLERMDLAEQITMRSRSGTPVRRSETPWELALKGETVQNAAFTIAAGDSEMRVLVSAAPLVSDGVVSGTVLVWRDVTEREALLESLARERQRVEDILTSITDGFAVLDSDGIYRYANQSLASMVGKQVEDIVGRYVWDVFPEAVGSDFDRALATVIRQESSLSFQQYYPPTDRWVEARVYPTAGGASIFASDVSERRRSEQERERLLEAYELEIARTSLLKDTSAAAGGSLSAQEICTLVLDTVRARLAPLRGALHLLDISAGALTLSAHFGHEDTQLAALRRLSPSPESPPGHLVREQLAIVTHESQPADDRLWGSGTGDERWLTLPILFAGQLLGTLSLAFEGRRPFTEDEVSLFRSIAAQLGIALDNARLYQREHRIADTLQQSLLADPSRVEGLEAGRVYRSATENVRVGGDFYDVHTLPGDRVAISIGDVSGKGLVAASVTALVRNTLRSHSLDGLAPHEVVQKTNEVLWYFSDSETFATAVFGVLHLADGRFEYCNGGHPSPLLLNAEGTIRSLEVSGPMLGAFQNLSYETLSVELGEDDLLLLYTDGVIEARNGDGFFGEERLARLLATLGDRSAEEVAQAIADAVSEFGDGMLRDDVALLALKRRAQQDA